MKTSKKKVLVPVDEHRSVEVIVPANWFNPYYTCLCSRCASRYYEDDETGIVRADFNQTVFDRCTMCPSTKGWDFCVFEIEDAMKKAS